MRASLILSLLFSLFLTACGTTATIPANKHISQSGPLKVHPGLLGQTATVTPVPAPETSSGR